MNGKQLAKAVGMTAAAPIIDALRLLLLSRRYPGVTFHAGTSVGKNCSFGKGVWIGPMARLGSVTLSDYTYVGGRSTLKYCTIGKFCSIGEGVQIGLGIHPVDQVSTYPGFYASNASGANSFLQSDSSGIGSSFKEFLPSRIGHDVWIGNHAIIMDGVEVGHGAIIGAGAVVTKNVEPYAIVGGVPARLIRKRFNDETIRKLLSVQWWHWAEDQLRLHAPLFSDPKRFLEYLADSLNSPQ